ncbi:ExbD/TolR family protein [Pedobacter caeni]|uniref:Biopolymer transport protein ExbD n=1 Tax=Pedobacter caeni TaxID=288992 RepID=A0A1M5P988_9SPHI|nr:biopolymer transporter ExbD [Pedobacter caeni]SHG98338.1 Biopolymer transport protein ExbD [Pedobacter caeni]
MATLSIPQNGQAMKGKSRTRKPVPSVDLTAMVDLAFLLITFFMLTTSLSKSQAMEIAKPVIDVPSQPYPASRTVTLLLGKANHIVWYRGEPGKAEPQKTTFATIHEVLSANKLAIAKQHGNDPSKFMVVIIKPTEKSTYKNFVDALDEMKISDVKSYLIDDGHLLKEDADLLTGLGL